MNEEFYDENKIIELGEADEIDSAEEGFMIGYMGAWYLGKDFSNGKITKEK